MQFESLPTLVHIDIVPLHSTMVATTPIALMALSHCISASAIDTSQRTHGYCKQLNIPVAATSDSAIYDHPRVDSNIEARAWAIYADTWDTPQGVQTVVKNTTTSATFNIYAQLCVPKVSGMKQGILQIATHGAHYDGKILGSRTRSGEPVLCRSIA
jgi:hypothetical protein